MGKIGCLGEIPFMVSDQTVQTIDGASWSGSARYSTHDIHNANAITEFTGIDPDSFSFEMTLAAYLGVDPMKIITKLWQYERSGAAVSLVIGDKAYGKYRWNVLKHKIKMDTYDARGNLAGAVVSVELQEYIKGGGEA